MNDVSARLAVSRLEQMKNDANNKFPETNNRLVHFLAHANYMNIHIMEAITRQLRERVGHTDSMS